MNGERPNSIGLATNPDPPAEDELPTCPRCHDTLTEYAYELDGQWVCEGCFGEYVGELTMEELADALRVDRKRREDTVPDAFSARADRWRDE